MPEILQTDDISHGPQSSQCTKVVKKIETTCLKTVKTDMKEGIKIEKEK